MRPIDADALKETIHKNFMSGSQIVRLWDLIDKLDTIDAVPVVRCKDCKHYKVEDGPCPAENASDSYYSWIPDPNWFCADGEKVNADV